MLCDINGVDLLLSGVNTHSSLRTGEKLHGTLRKRFLKVKHAHPNIPNRYILRVAVKAMNDTINENGLVPSRLVFGIIPLFPIINTDLPTKKNCMNGIKTAQDKMNSIVAKRGL